MFLGGLIDENGAQVIKDKVAVLGPNDGDVKLLAPDGFTTQATIDECGHGVEGHVHVGRRRADRRVQGRRPRSSSTALQGPARRARRSTRTRSTAAQAAQVMLDAIAASDGTRADVITKMFETTSTDGLLGSFTINENGDPEEACGAVVGFTIYKATDKLDDGRRSSRRSRRRWRRQPAG